MKVILFVLMLILLFGGVTAAIVYFTKKSDNTQKGCGGACQTNDDCAADCPCDSTTKLCTKKEPVKLYCGHTCDPNDRNSYCPTECPCTGGICATPPPRILTCGDTCDPSDSSRRCPDTCNQCIDGICAIPTHQCGDTCKIGDPTSRCPQTCPCSGGICKTVSKKCGDTCSATDICPTTCPCSNGVCKVPVLSCGQSCDPTGSINTCPDSCPCANTGPGSYSCHAPVPPSPNIPKGGVCNTRDTMYATCTPGTTCVNNVCAQFLKCGETCDPHDSANICAPLSPVSGMIPSDDGKGPCCPCVTGPDGKSKCTKPTLKSGDVCRVGCSLHIDSIGAGCPDDEICLADVVDTSRGTESANGHCTG